MGVFLAGCATQSNEESALFESIEKLTEAGDQALQQNDLDEAETIFAIVANNQPSEKNWLRLAGIQRALGKIAPSCASLRHALTFNDANIDAHEQLGIQLIDLKEHTEARSHLERVLDLDPDRWRVHNALGVIADMEQDHDAAIGHYVAALELKPQSASILNNLGYSHYLTGNHRRARHHFLAAVSLDKTYRPAIINLGLANAREGNYHRALELLLGSMPAAAAHNDTGFIAYKNGDIREAEAMLRRALELSPTYYETAARNLKLVEDEIRRRNGSIQLISPNSGPSTAQPRAQCIEHAMESVRAGTRHILDVIDDCDQVSTDR